MYWTRQYYYDHWLLFGIWGCEHVGCKTPLWWDFEEEKYQFVMKKDTRLLQHKGQKPYLQLNHLLKIPKKKTRFINNLCVINHEIETDEVGITRRNNHLIALTSLFHIPYWNPCWTSSSSFSSLSCVNLWRYTVTKNTAPFLKKIPIWFSRLVTINPYRIILILNQNKRVPYLESGHQKN